MNLMKYHRGDFDTFAAYFLIWIQQKSHNLGNSQTYHGFYGPYKRTYRIFWIYSKYMGFA